MRKGFYILWIAFLASCRVETGAKAPLWKGNFLENQAPVTFDYTNKITVINLWATWCGPCVQEIPQLNQLVKQNISDSSIVFMAMSDDSPEKLTAFLSQKEFLYQQVYTSRSELKKWSGTLLMSYPQHILVGPDGHIYFNLAGTRENLTEIIQEKINELKEHGN